MSYKSINRKSVNDFIEHARINGTKVKRVYDVQHMAKSDKEFSLYEVFKEIEKKAELMAEYKYYKKINDMDKEIKDMRTTIAILNNRLEEGDIIKMED